MDIVVTQTPSQSLEVREAPGLEVTRTSSTQSIEVDNGLSQQNLYVSELQPEFSGPGLWIQTGLGNDGSGFTFWIEDGLS